MTGNGQSKKSAADTRTPARRRAYLGGGIKSGWMILRGWFGMNEVYASWNKQKGAPKIVSCRVAREKVERR